MKKVFTLSAILLVAIAAWATVSFNADTGVGFIGRGDVITYVGKAGLTTTPNINYSREEVVTWTCTKEGRHDLITQSRTNRNILAYNVQYDTRQAKGNGNISGYLLSGSVGHVFDIHNGPALDSCPEGDSGFVYDVGSDVVTVTGSGLYFNGVNIPY